jgi:hypothetical protein
MRELYERLKVIISCKLLAQIYYASQPTNYLERYL